MPEPVDTFPEGEPFVAVGSDGVRRGFESFQSEWEKRKERILEQEREGMRKRLEDLNDDDIICYHYGRAGHYPFLSENFPVPNKFYYEGKYWPTAQHAYQASKFRGHSEAHQRVREAICRAGEPRDAKAIALRPENKMLIAPSFNEGFLSREIMYDVLCYKFNLRGPEGPQPSLPHKGSCESLLHLNLSLRLHKTGARPIYHIHPSDEFWGVKKPPETDEELLRDGNWNGRILMVIRQRLKEELFRDMQATALSRTSSELECPVPEGWESGFLRNQAAIQPGSLVAGRFRVERRKGIDAGSYAGSCWICRDEYEDKVEDLTTISWFLTKRVSLSELRLALRRLIVDLTDGSPPDWGGLLGEGRIVQRIEQERFPNRTAYPSWWTELVYRLEAAKGASDRAQPLEAAFLLHQLLHAPTRPEPPQVRLNPNS